MSDERNTDEEILYTLLEGFIKFLDGKPKIRYNLHENLRKIVSECEFITANL